VRIASVITDIPPAWSICIAMLVPERGRPETMTIGARVVIAV
jgi:hypothetical protein